MQALYWKFYLQIFVLEYIFLVHRRAAVCLECVVTVETRNFFRDICFVLQVGAEGRYQDGISVKLAVNFL